MQSMYLLINKFILINNALEVLITDVIYVVMKNEHLNYIVLLSAHFHLNKEKKKRKRKLTVGGDHGDNDGGGGGGGLHQHRHQDANHQTHHGILNIFVAHNVTCRIEHFYFQCTVCKVSFTCSLKVLGK